MNVLSPFYSFCSSLYISFLSLRPTAAHVLCLSLSMEQLIHDAVWSVSCMEVWELLQLHLSLGLFDCTYTHTQLLLQHDAVWRWNDTDSGWQRGMGIEGREYWSRVSLSIFFIFVLLYLLFPLLSFNFALPVWMYGSHCCKINQWQTVRP